MNGKVGWYVGPAMNHYRCVTAYFPRTRTTRICDTVTFFPHEVPFPRVTLNNQLLQAAEDIVNILNNPPATAVPTLQVGDPVKIPWLRLPNNYGRWKNFPRNRWTQQLRGCLKFPTLSQIRQHFQGYLRQIRRKHRCSSSKNTARIQNAFNIVIYQHINTTCASARCNHR